MDDIESNPILARLRNSIINKNAPAKGNLASVVTANKILQNISTAKPQVIDAPVRTKEIKENIEKTDKENKVYKPPIRSTSNSKPNKNFSVNTSSTRDSFLTPNQTAIQNDNLNIQEKSQTNQIKRLGDEVDMFSSNTYNTHDNDKNKIQNLGYRYNNETDFEVPTINGKIKDLAAEFDNLLCKENIIESNYKTVNAPEYIHQNYNFNTKTYVNNQNKIPKPNSSLNNMKLLPETFMRSRSPDRYNSNKNPISMNNQMNPINSKLRDNDIVNTTYESMDFNNQGYYQNNYFSTQTYSYKKQNNVLINLEDLMLLEEKLGEIMNNILDNRPVFNESFEWWNFYFNCSLCGKLQYYFKDESEKLTINEYNVIELLSIIICYDSSHDKDLLNTIQPLLKSILNLIQQNFLIICLYILSKVASESLSNIWVQKLRILTEKKLLSKENPNNIGNIPNKTFYLLSYAIEIKSNNKSIYDYLRIILKNYPQRQEKTDQLISYFKNLQKINVDTLNDFFRTKILRVINKNASVLASVLFNKDGIYTDNSIPVPYLKNESVKKLTLVLDLDETLIHFKLDEKDDNKGLLRLRPGLFEFLDSVSKFYELVIFTAATSEVKFLFIFLVC